MTTHPKLEVLLGAGVCWCGIRNAPYHDAATTPPRERARWHAESLVKFDDRIATQAV